MSDESKFNDPLHKQIEETALLESKKKEVLSKELIVRERRAESAIEKIEQGDKDAEIAKNTSYGGYTEQDILNKQKDNEEYMLSARNKMTFVNKSFDVAVPLFRKNIILIGAQTGHGKSTTVANIVRSIIKEPDPITGKRRRVLVLTNEEAPEDVYNRVTCLIKGWNYVNHDKFDDNHIKTFNEYISHMSKGGMLTVIDDNYGGARGTTSTLEGICQVFDNLIKNKEYYDAIILDYYQNIKESRRYPDLDEYKVQAALVRKLDTYKNIYPAPIVVLAQVTPPDSERATPFRPRIEGRKSIMNVSTCAIEMVADRENFCTEWWIHKGRFSEMIGKKIITGYDRGRYVEYDEEFKAKVSKDKASIAKTELDKQIGHMPVFREDDKNGNNE